MNDFVIFIVRALLAFALAVHGGEALASSESSESWQAVIDAFIGSGGYVSAGLVFVGYRARLVARLLGTAAFVHLIVLPWDFTTLSTLKDLLVTAAYAGGFLSLAALGAGGLSVDAWLRQRRYQRLEASCTRASGPPEVRGHHRNHARNRIDECIESGLGSKRVFG